MQVWIAYFLLLVCVAQCAPIADPQQEINENPSPGYLSELFETFAKWIGAESVPLHQLKSSSAMNALTASEASEDLWREMVKDQYVMIFPSSQLIYDVINPYDYHIYSVPLKELDQLESGTKFVIFVTASCFSGEISIYLTTKTIASPSYYSVAFVASRGTFVTKEATAGKEDTVFITVQGSRELISQQYKIEHAPRISDYSLSVVVRRDDLDLRPHVKLPDGIVTFSGSKVGFPVYHVYERENIENSIYISLTALEESVRLYLSTTNPYPSQSNHELSFRAESHTNAAVALASIPSTSNATTFYVSIYLEGTIDSSVKSKQTLLFWEGDYSIKIMNDVQVSMYRPNTRSSAVYHFQLCEDTGNYKWMQIILLAQFGLNFYVKVGAPPSRTDFDWSWSFSGLITEWQNVYILATDPKFVPGDYYIWFDFPHSNLAIRDGLGIHLEPWMPRMI